MLTHKALLQEEFNANVHVLNLAQTMTNLGDQLMYSKGTTKIDNVSGKDGFAVTVQLSKRVALDDVIPVTIASATPEQLTNIIEQALEQLIVCGINSKNEKLTLTKAVNRVNRQMKNVSRMNPTDFQFELSLVDAKDNF